MYQAWWSFFQIHLKTKTETKIFFLFFRNILKFISTFITSKYSKTVLNFLKTVPVSPLKTKKQIFSKNPMFGGKLRETNSTRPREIRKSRSKGFFLVLSLRLHGPKTQNKVKI